MNAVLEEFQRRQAKQVAILAEANVDTTPEDAARRLRQSRQLGVSPQVAGAIPDRTHVQEVTEAIGRAPRVGEWIKGSGDRLALARGGFSNLADTAEHVEQKVQPKGFLDRARRVFEMGPLGLGAELRGAFERGASDITLPNVAASLRAGAADIAAGQMGTLQAASELGGIGFMPGIQAAETVLGLATGNKPGATFGTMRQAWEKVAQEQAPEAKTAEGEGILAGFRSVPGSLTALVGGAYTKSAGLAASLMGVTTGGASYGRARDYGLSSQQAALYGGIDAAIETGTELIPFTRLLPGGGRSFMRRALESTTADVLGEQVATLGQDFNQWAQIDSNEGKTFEDFLGERPEAAYTTLIASMVTSGALNTALGAAELASNRFGRRVADTSGVEETERFTRGLADLAKASTVLQRDPRSFEEFVAEAAEQSGGPEAVFIEAEQLAQVLNQSDLTVEQVFEMTGLMPEQLEQAAQRGEDITIPIGEYAARVAPLPVNEQLMPHIRLDPDDMSRSQAETFMQAAQQEFQRDTELEMAKLEAGDVRATSRAAVEERVLAELNTTRRFTEDTNRVYAALVGAFFDTQSAKVGLTAEELADQYGLKVQSGEVAQPTFDQAPMVNIGLRISDALGGGDIDPEVVRAALTGMGVQINSEAIQQSGTEPTFVAALDRPLTPDEAETISEQLQQDAIAQSAGDQSGLFGPRAAEWGEFNPDFFLDLQGQPLSAVYNQPAAELQTLPLGVRGTGPGGRIRNWDLGEALTLRHRAEYGRALDPTDPGDYQIALQSLLTDYENQKAQPDNGEAWYSDDIAAALEITTRILPELEDPVRRDIFLTAVALLSPQQGPIDNWNNAIVAMTGYSIEGRFADRHPDGTQFGVKSHSTGLGLFEHLIREHGEIGALVWLSSEHTGAEMEAVRRASGLYRNKADNYLPSETNKTESKLGVYIFGPKVGDFMLNSAGLDQNAVTVDLWMARTFNRVIGRLTDVNAKQAAEGGLADAMRGKAERAIVKQLVRDAAQQAGIAPSAMQAALWYFEQRLYRNHGIKSESTSFSDAAREAALRRGVPVDGPAAEGSAQRSDEAESRDPEEGVRVYRQGDPLDAFKAESFYPSRAVRHADDVVYADIPSFYPDRQARLAEQLGAAKVVAVESGDPRLQQGVPLWHSTPPLQPDGTIRLDHWGSPGITETDPARWGESGTLGAAERGAITSGLPRTYFGIASGEPGGYIIEFPGRQRYSVNVPAERLYDVAADPAKLKPAKSVAELERKIKAAGYLGYWTADPQLGLVATVFEPLAVQPAQPQVYAQDAVFFSALERAVERTATTKASAQQWEATLRKTPGIKEEELEWTGILDFLADVEGPITREQMLEVVRGAGLRVDEVVLGEPRPETWFEAGWSIEEVEGGWIAIDPSGMEGDPFPTRAQAESSAQGGAAFDAVTYKENTQFASWSSDPNNETYRELLITLPIGTGRNPNRAPSTHWDTDGVIAHARFMDKVDADGKRVLFIEEVQSDWHQKGRDQGYEEKINPAQRVAAREVYAAAQKYEDEVLFQLGDRMGVLWQQFFDTFENAMERMEWAMRNPQPQGTWSYGQITREAGVYRNDEEVNRLVAEVNAARLRTLEASQILTNLGAARGIPNAPFKTSWPALVMKRMIRYAAEHGYERIAWTTGKQQAERYNLSQAVGTLTYRIEEDGRVKVNTEGDRGYEALRQYGEMGPAGSTLFTREQAEETFGQEITRKMWASEGGEDDGTGHRKLEGSDLRVGGEGMKAFYDRNLVNITNSLIKKYGARVVPVALKNDDPGLRAAEDMLNRAQAGGGDVAWAEENLAKYKARVGEQQTQPGFDLTDDLKNTAMGGFPLFQRERAPRGQIAFAADITQAPSVITLLRGADLSTFVHELGHFFFEVTNHMASRAGAPAEIVADRDAMLRYLGAESVTEWENRTPDQRREGHERLARSFEAYLFTGKAPSLELRGVFSKLRSWMLTVYRTITRLNVELTDEVRGVFDRMLASEEQIAEAESDAELRPLFADKPEGMSDVDWEEYQRLNSDATAEAAKSLESRSLRDMRYAGKAVARELKRLQRQVADQRAEMREEVEADLGEMPIYRAIRELRSKDSDLKLHTGILKDLLQLGDAPLGDAFRGMTSQDGVHPQQVAELFGFTSAHHLATDILFASPFKEAVEAETDARMRERYGELNTAEEVEEAARAAVHNEVRSRFVATELAALQNAPGKKRVLAAAAKRLAESMIARTRIRDLRPSQYEAAERRAARAAAEAGTTDLDEAIRQKRNQLLQFNLAKAAHEARDETKAARDYLQKFTLKKTRANLDPDFMDQIDQLMERYELRAVSNKEADRRKAYAAWVEQMREQGFEPAMPPEEMAELGRKPWRELTVEEMRGLLDTIRNIEYLARKTKEIMLARDKATLDEAAAEMAEAVRVNARRSIELPVGARTWFESLKSGAADFFAMHRKIANLVHVFDGNQYGGVFWERYIRPMNERGDWQAKRNREANERLAELFKDIAQENTTRREYEPAIGRSISLEDRVMVALNMGNEANLQRLMSGDRWEYEQVLAVVAPLEGRHWDFVESVWREIDSYWPEIAAKERRVSGVEPEKVEPLPFQVEVGGELRLIPGGYFPIKYDPDKSAKADADESAEVLKQMTRGLYTNAQTRRGHTKARVEAVNNRALRKSFGVIFGHVNQVIHDLAWHEYLIDANRLLKHGAVDAAIREHYGPETVRWMRKALEDIAIGDIPAQDAFEKSIRHLRTGVSISAMGWSIWTSLLQPTGLTQSMSRIGSRWVLKGLGDWIGNPAKANAKLQWIRDNSTFMRERGDTMQREISEIKSRIGAQSPLRAGFAKVIPQGVSSAVGDSFFYMIAKAQLIADVPTWLGQYEKSLAGGEQHDRAVAMADQAVIDSQGAGQTKDLAGIQRGSQLMKLFTNFYSYFSATFNLMADRTTQMRRVGPRDLPYYAIDMMLLSVVPATIASLMYQLLKGGDDEEPEDLLKQVAQDNLVYTLGLMVGVREIGSALAGIAGYTGPAGARFFSETGRFGKQVAQGEVDEPLLRAGNSMAGILFHYPSTQLDRTVRGIIQLSEGEGEPQAVLVGPPAGQ